MSSFADLRLSPGQFASRSKSQGASSTIWQTVSSPARWPLKIIGYDEETSAALRLASDKGDDFMLVDWGHFDSMLWVMLRLEQKLRIPVEYWGLAADGVILSAGVLVSTNSVFKNAATQQIVLTLLHSANLRTYFLKHAKIHPWRRLTSLSPPSSPYPSPFALARAKYHLFVPSDTLGFSPYGSFAPKYTSGHWSKYTAERGAADKNMRRMLSQFQGEDLDPVLYGVKEAVGNMLMKTGLDAKEWPVVADGVLVLKYQRKYDVGNVRSATIWSRIYSPCNPTSVDVHFRYHHRVRWNTVEWVYDIMIRINDPTAEDATHSNSHFQRCCSDRAQCYHSSGSNSDENTPPDSPPSPPASILPDFTRQRTSRVMRRRSSSSSSTTSSPLDLSEEEPDIGVPGWKAVCTMESGDKEFLLSERDIKEVHEVLFGSGALSDDSDSDEESGAYPNDVGLSTKLSRVDTLRLLLASLGIEFLVASTENGIDGDPQPYSSVAEPPLSWELGPPWWLAMQIRKICGCPLEKDSRYVEEPSPYEVCDYDY